MTIVFFSLSGLDLLYAQDILDKDKEETIKFIYALQLLPDLDGKLINHFQPFRYLFYIKISIVIAITLKYSIFISLTVF